MTSCSDLPPKFRSAARELPTEEVLAIREGVPQVPRDILHLVPPEQNAAVNYLRASHTSWREPPELRSNFPGEPFRFYVLPQDPDVVAGVAKPHCSYDHDYSLGRDVPFPELELLRFARLYSERLQYGVDSEQDNFDSMSKMQGHLFEEPSYKAFAAAAQISSLQKRGVELGLERSSSRMANLSVEDVKRYWRPIPDYDFPLRGESVLLQMETHRRTPELPRNIVKSVDANDLQEALGARGLQLYRKAFTIARSNVPDIAKDRAISALVAEERAGDETHMLNRLMLPPTDIGKLRLTIEAERSLIIEGLRLKEALSRSGNVMTIQPTSEDPFTGGKLRKLVQGSTAIVYSVGANLQDEKGFGDDLTFSLSQHHDATSLR